MSSFYIIEGTQRWPTDKANLQIQESLTPATYTVKMHPQRGLYLDMIGDFERPKKVYGAMNATADRIVKSFVERPSGTGVLLEGIKGTGKSMLAKLLSIKAREELGYPTIVINQPLHGEAFNAFIQSIDQPAVILFDEFEKVYDRDDQRSMLTLLDGMYPTKKLFVLTCNDKYRIDEHMQNRPGRLYYSLSFAGLTEREIREYCADVLGNKTYTDNVVKFSQLFRRFTFDMLKALIEEMNRFNESPSKAYKMLNVKPGNEEDGATYSVSLTFQGQPLSIQNPTVWNGVPFSDDEDGMSEWVVCFNNPNYSKKKQMEQSHAKRSSMADWLESLGDEEPDDGTTMAETNPHSLARFVAEDYWVPGCTHGRHVFKNKEGFEVTLTPKERRAISYDGTF